eukprot:MONOS_4334.1-p1 / transcript=MONOS_4334.1 / gene=MONOS_4334 / organism=Monocercomonoides_exilis_PA203 / gene_product=YALI0D08822p / transcript_product=YALI0D08822p / location=Mono_scaffold00114:18018-23648(+) / protein_length=1665 / sequence_SO=supercontig / SO=protein_coding / is_pseudo=false
MPTSILDKGEQKMLHSSPSQESLISFGDNDIKETDSVSTYRDEQTGRKIINQYVILQNIGSGSFAKVKLCYEKNAPEIVYALKVVKKAAKKMLGPPRRGGNETNASKEIAIMKKTNHPNIMKLKEVIDDAKQRKLYMVIEYLPRGPCYVDGQPPLSEDLARKYMRQIILGIDYLHTYNIVHHDIKVANILLDKDDNCKICDLGVSLLYPEINTRIREIRGTPAYIPPEALQVPLPPEGYVASKHDIWSLGVLLYHLLFGHPPFLRETICSTYQAIRTEDAVGIYDDEGDAEDAAEKEAAESAANNSNENGVVPNNLSGDSNANSTDSSQLEALGKRSTPNPNESGSPDSNGELHQQERLRGKELSPDVKDLMRKLLEKDPDKRITIKGIMTHKWITQNGQFPLEQPTGPQCSVTVTEDEINASVTPLLSFKQIVSIQMKMKHHLRGLRERLLERRNSASPDTNAALKKRSASVGRQPFSKLGNTEEPKQSESLEQKRKHMQNLTIDDPLPISQRDVGEVGGFCDGTAKDPTFYLRSTTKARTHSHSTSYPELPLLSQKTSSSSLKNKTSFSQLPQTPLSQCSTMSTISSDLSEESIMAPSTPTSNAFFQNPLSTMVSGISVATSFDSDRVGYGGFEGSSPLSSPSYEPPRSLSYSSRFPKSQTPLSPSNQSPLRMKAVASLPQLGVFSSEIAKDSTDNLYTSASQTAQGVVESPMYSDLTVSPAGFASDGKGWFDDGIDWDADLDAEYDSSANNWRKGGRGKGSTTTLHADESESGLQPISSAETSPSSSNDTQKLWSADAKYEPPPVDPPVAGMLSASSSTRSLLRSASTDTSNGSNSSPLMKAYSNDDVMEQTDLSVQQQQKAYSASDQSIFVIPSLSPTHVSTLKGAEPSFSDIMFPLPDTPQSHPQYPTLKASSSSSSSSHRASWGRSSQSNIVATTTTFTSSAHADIPQAAQSRWLKWKEKSLASYLLQQQQNDSIPHLGSSKSVSCLAAAEQQSDMIDAEGKNSSAADFLAPSKSPIRKSVSSLSSSSALKKFHEKNQPDRSTAPIKTSFSASTSRDAGKVMIPRAVQVRSDENTMAKSKEESYVMEEIIDEKDVKTSGMDHEPISVISKNSSKSNANVSYLDKPTEISQLLLQHLASPPFSANQSLRSSHDRLSASAQLSAASKNRSSLSKPATPSISFVPLSLSASTHQLEKSASSMSPPVVSAAADNKQTEGMKTNGYVALGKRSPSLRFEKLHSSLAFERKSQNKKKEKDFVDIQKHKNDERDSNEKEDISSSAASSASSDSKSFDFALSPSTSFYRPMTSASTSFPRRSLQTSSRSLSLSHSSSHRSVQTPTVSSHSLQKHNTYTPPDTSAPSLILDSLCSNSTPLQTHLDTDSTASPFSSVPHSRRSSETSQALDSASPPSVSFNSANSSLAFSASLQQSSSPPPAPPFSSDIAPSHSFDGSSSRTASLSSFSTDITSVETHTLHQSSSVTFQPFASKKGSFRSSALQTAASTSRSSLCSSFASAALLSHSHHSPQTHQTHQTLTHTTQSNAKRADRPSTQQTDAACKYFLSRSVASLPKPHQLPVNSLRHSLLRSIASPSLSSTSPTSLFSAVSPQTLHPATSASVPLISLASHHTTVRAAPFHPSSFASSASVSKNRQTAFLVPCPSFWSI